MEKAEKDEMGQKEEELIRRRMIKKAEKEQGRDGSDRGK